MLKDKNIIYIKITFFVCFLLNSCTIPLTEEQLKIIDCVNVGDTLIFQANSGECDTMVISDKKIYLQELNPIFGNTWYRPQNAVVKFYSINRDNGQTFTNGEWVTSTYDLIHIYGGRTPSDSAKITIDIRYFNSFTYNNLGEEIFEPVEINGETYSGYFILTGNCPDYVPKDSCDIQKLYWHLDKGLLKYVNIKKQEWTRIK